MNSTTPAPSPDQSARDEHGRLVAASWGSTRELAGPARWLVAVDGSAGSQRAAMMVARLVASDPRPAVDLVHVHPWLVKEAADAELPRRGWNAAAAARTLMEQGGIQWRVHVRMGEAADQIVALGQDLGSLGIAIGSHGLTAAESLFLGSVAYKVVHLGRMPVLIVR